MKILLDPSLLGDSGLSEYGEGIVRQVLEGSSFYVSAISHFQLLWGYRTAGMSAERYERFLDGTAAEIVPLTRLDADFASELKPTKADLLDALIAGSVRRYDASIWTRDSDFLKFLPKAKVRLF
ncbi:MAG: PIN domain-containing protein [Thaumarchaeota archaeon]|nr:PIN domain-containing protein [Nitrososphaerota archaeon]